MVNMKKCNYVISAVAAVLGVAIWALSAGLGIGFKEEGGISAGTWPAITGGIMVGAALILLVMTLVNRKKYEEMEVVLGLPANRRVYLVMGIMVVYCLLLNVLGLYISGLILIPALMWVLGERNKKKTAIVTIVALAAIYVIFSLILGTKLPEPFFM
ncbi:MAG: tripartite tricarboxylate transporter TctB family protein [Lachnospiraceae bacterium]|nr:tripartite tricarboxylate transporter TctB family protein [Lachnospiraceae bacterium]